MSNYFPMRCVPTVKLYRHHVDFAPTLDSAKLRYALLMQHEKILGPIRVYDENSILLLPRQLDVSIVPPAWHVMCLFIGCKCEVVVR